MGLKSFFFGLRQQSSVTEEQEEINYLLWDDGTQMAFGDGSSLVWDDTVWILAAGVWNDNGQWDDDNVWIDGE